MHNTPFIIALALCFSSALAVNVLHFWMKFRLLNANLPVKWMMMPWDDWRMWKTYRTEAPARNWPVWPFYAYKALLLVFGLSGIMVLVNADKLDKMFGG